MLGADVAIAYIDGYRGYANDYNITANSPVSTANRPEFRANSALGSSFGTILLTGGRERVGRGVGGPFPRI